MKIVICKKNIIVVGFTRPSIFGKTFRKGNSYIVDNFDINNINNKNHEVIYIRDDNNHSCGFVSDDSSDLDSDRDWIFLDYFYTEKEMRQLKLKQLDENSL